LTLSRVKQISLAGWQRPVKHDCTFVEDRVMSGTITEEK